MKVMYALTLATVVAPALGEPLSYKFDSGIELFPNLGIQYRSNDNIARASEDTDRVEITELNGGLAFEVETNRYLGEHTYALSLGDSSDGRNDYIDQKFDSSNKFELNSRNRLNVNYLFRNQHEERGTGLTASDAFSNLLDEPLEYTFHDIGFNYIYGSQGAKGRIEAGANYRDKRYQNFRDISDSEGSRFNDFSSVTGHGEFYLRLSPVTYWLLGSRVLLKEYQHQRPSTAADNNPNKDSNSYFYYTGFSWSLTGKTEGVAKFGVQQKSFDSNSRDDFQGFSWNVKLNWLPQEQTTIAFRTSQAAIDPDQQGDYNLQTTFAFEAIQDWNSKLSSQFNTTYTLDDYSNGLRNEELLSLGVEGTYQIQRWLGLSAYYQFENNQSSNSSYEYQQNIFGLSVYATL